MLSHYVIEFMIYIIKVSVESRALLSCYDLEKIERIKIIGIIRFMPLVVSHSFVLPLIPKSHRFCPSHFAPLMLLPFDRLTVSLKTS